MEKSETTRRRIAGKRAVEDDVSVSSKKERLECTDLSLVSPSPETTSVRLQLGDIRSAFLEDSLDRKQGPLYWSLPPRGIPGVPDDAVMLTLGNIYGSNDAPQRWWKKLDAVMSSIGFSRSTFDVCVYSLKSTAGNLEGILCVHVDDTICGGSGSLFSEALSNLRHRFPFRKWMFAAPSMCRTMTTKRS